MPSSVVTFGVWCGSGFGIEIRAPQISSLKWLGRASCGYGCQSLVAMLGWKGSGSCFMGGMV